MSLARALALGVLSLAIGTGTASGEEQAPVDVPTSPPGAAAVDTPLAKPIAVPAEKVEAVAGESQVQAALRRQLSEVPEGTTDEDKKEREALLAFYEARAHAPLWIAPKGLNAKAQSVVSALGAAGEWGLEAGDFPRPKIESETSGGSDLTPETVAGAEIELSRSVLKYARFARGGRIIAPSELLTTQIDRRPQLVAPKTVLDDIASADGAGAYLSGLNPKHPQFERLRQKYLAARKGSADQKKILANMEMWRWMHVDLGDLHVFANVPEFMLRLVENGEVIHTERIVAGEIGKQTTIFSRPLKNIVFRPMWRVPESIKVRELWPSLKRGGGLMRQHGLEIETKDGKSLNWRTMDWSKEDIRTYEVVQPPGGKSALGVVKFSFPSQHTIYMHDTPDKWMFNSRQRTLSHGCLRLRNPLRLAEIILARDKGWDAAKIADLIRSGPLNNEIAIEKKIRVHLAYFTAWVDDGGSLKTFADVYGHEKRVTQALEGKWSAIDKGRDHLAAVEPVETSAAPMTPQQKQSQTAFDDFLGNVFGGF